MITDGTAVDRFLQTWIEEFTRAVEMFSGEVPSLRCSRTKNLVASEISDLFWWKQDFAGDGRFTTWIGTKNETLLALGGSTDAAEAKSTLLEIIGQAQNGTAHVLSSSLDSALKCEGGEEATAPSTDSLSYGIVGITLGGKELPSLVFAIESSIEDLFRVEELEPERAQNPERNQASLVAAANQPMLSRLMELELPLSIALGRATMPIRDVLKVTSGSVIQLDRNVGEPVELLVHGTVVARGEVVSVKGNYAVRIKEIISQQDRLHLYNKQ